MENESKKIILSLVFLFGIFFLFRGSSVFAAPCAGNCVYTWGEEAGTCDTSEVIDTNGQCPLGGSFNTEGMCCIKKSADPTSGKVCFKDKGMVAGKCYNGGITGCMGIGPGLALTGEAGVTDCPSGQICCKTQEYQNATQGKPETTPTSTNPSSAASSAATPVRDPGGLVPCDQDCTLCHIVVGFKRIFDWLMGLLFVATMLVITISGVFYMVSTGSKSIMDKAKKALTYALTAFVLGMACWLIINIIMIMLGFQNPTGGNWWEFTCDTTQTQGAAQNTGVLGGGSGSGSGAGAGGGTGGKITGTGLVSSGNATLDQVAQNLKDKTVYRGSKGGWIDGVFYADCSSWTQEFSKEAYGWDPGGTTAEQLKNAQRDANGSLITDVNSLKPGDVVVTTGGGATGRHSNIYMGNGMVVSNQGTGLDVRTSPLKEEKILGIVKAPA